MIATICKAPGCFRLAAPPARYCAGHAGLQAADDAKAAAGASQRWDRHHDAHPEWSAIYKDRRWIALRRRWIYEHPWCALCGKKGATVDHIVPHRGNEALAFDTANVQTLCGACHARKTRMDRP